MKTMFKLVGLKSSFFFTTHAYLCITCRYTANNLKNNFKNFNIPITFINYLLPH